MLIYKIIQACNPKCGQILCAHKPYFLMPGHICEYSRSTFADVLRMFATYFTKLIVVQKAHMCSWSQS